MGASKAIGRPATAAYAAPVASSSLLSSAADRDVMYALTWSAGSAAGTGAAPVPLGLPTPTAAMAHASIPHIGTHPQRGVISIAALQSMAAMAASGGGAMVTQLQTRGAVSVSSDCGGSGGCSGVKGAGAAAGGESLRAAWRVTAGELQSAATFSAVDFVPNTASRSANYRGTDSTIGCGGHGAAFAANVVFAPAALGSVTQHGPSPEFAGSSISFSALVHRLFGATVSSSLSQVQHLQRRVGVGSGALLTGGGGGLGTLMTSWLVRSVGHSSITVLGRSGRSKQLDAASIQDGEAVIRVVRCDVSASDEMRDAAGNRGGPQTASVLHAGGVLADATVINQTAGSFASAIAPKAGLTPLLLLAQIVLRI